MFVESEADWAVKLNKRAAHVSIDKVFRAAEDR